MGAFDVDPITGEIGDGDSVRRVQPKVMDVLVCLAEHAGELVERDALLSRVWGRPTSEEVLTRCISELRRALEDDRAQPQYIQTVPKRGYRLLKSLAFASNGLSATALPHAERGPLTDPPSPGAALAAVAVLPFESHSPDESDRYLADAFTIELHSTLARVDRLLIAARRSSFALGDPRAGVREIGSQLNVDYVISGSLQRDGDNLRIIAELADTSTGTQVWAQSYDRRATDVLAVEREVAEAIVGTFVAVKQVAEMQHARVTPTLNLDAWGLVQKSRAMTLDYTAEALEAAIEPVRRAIELDPEYAAAHATLGSLLVERLINGLSATIADDERKAAQAAEKAAVLAPRDPFILKMLGIVWAYCGEPGRSLASLRQAVALAPFDFGAWGYMGWPLTASGDPDDLAELEHILERLLTLEIPHPGVAFWLYHRSVLAACRQDYGAARGPAEAAVAINPKFALAWMHYANLLGQQGERAQARVAVERCLAVNPCFTVEHYVALVKRLSRSDTIVAARTGGLAGLG